MRKTFRVAILVILGGYLLASAGAPETFHFIDYTNLIFHEAGHWLFWPFGEFIGFAGGSLNQVLIPLVVAGYFFGHRQNLSGSLSLMWAGESLTNVSVYAGDALKMQLPLLGGDSSIHDWNWMLIYLGQLRHTVGIAQFINMLGWLALLAGLLGGLYFILTESESVNYEQS